jgi:sugar phosphate isomerase/epimerase
MKISVSNIAFPPFDHEAELSAMPALGISGIEVAPSRVWQKTWQGLTVKDVSAYRGQVEQAGMGVVGLHSLLFDHPELRLFDGEESRGRLLDFFVHLSGVCRDLGGHTLIWGGGRTRGQVQLPDAETAATAFMAELAYRIENHGTVFCFEPLGPMDSDFINSSLTSLRIAKEVAHPAIAVQLDAKALSENDEIQDGIFDAVREYLVHVHVNEPKLGVIGSSGTIDHVGIAAQLRRINYKEFISLEQRMLNAEDPVADVSMSISAIRQIYCGDSF